MNKKVIALLMVCVLALGCAIGGTMAWLVDSTENVVNTFTVGDINIELTEHDYDPETGMLSETTTITNADYKFVPGDTLPKDPYVTVKKDSEACYLFVKVVVENNACTGNDANGSSVTVNPIITWAIAEGWTWYDTNKTDTVEAYSTENGTYYFYRTVEAVSADTNFAVLKDDEVSVSDEVTKAMVETINTTKPTLTFTAAAVQKAHIGTVDNAWEQLPTAFKPATSGT